MFIKRIYLIVTLLSVNYFLGYAQIVDTVYFDTDGFIIIKEFSSLYRIAEYDTNSGEIIGRFKDFDSETDSLIGSGISTYGLKEKIKVKEYKGDESHLERATKMCNLDAVYIRIKDYPDLKRFIKKHPTNEDRTDMGDFIVIELNPEFPGGMEYFGLFLSQLLKYPEEAAKNNVTGIVKVRFLVDTDGSLNNFSILEGIGYGCDEEAIRVMKLIPDWLPGLQRGIPVKTYLTVPIRFE